MKTKAQTLNFLKNNLLHGKILPLSFFSVKDWENNTQICLKELLSTLSLYSTFIVRSSAQSEDQITASNAGAFESILNVTVKDLEKSIQIVISSYGGESNPADEILVQPMLQDVVVSGVLFTRDPNTEAPYYIINYETDGNTTAVTSGQNSVLKTHIIAHSCEVISDPRHQRLIKLAQELQEKLNISDLDIEFAFDKNDTLFLFQVRPLIIKKYNELNEQKKILNKIKNKFSNVSLPHPYLSGQRTILGVMPDWNPAEIIGIRPKPLALSLYKELITDRTWAYQRDNYGYKNLRSFPLLIDLMGLPYIDVRVSFNSFIPKNLEPALAEKLVNYYLDVLEKNPHFHDKIEFEIVFSCYTFDLNTRLQKLKDHGFSAQEIHCISESLKKLTNTIIHQDKGLWIQDSHKITELKNRHEVIFFQESFDELTKIYWLIEDCKRYGTLPFAGLARAGFIAVQLLNSMMETNILSQDQRLSFLNSLNSISTKITRDLYSLNREHFLQKYGHLRPGTYDILSSRYDEESNLYFDWDKTKISPVSEKESFMLSLPQMQKIELLLNEHGLEHDIVGLFTFMKAAIEGRESSKFVFTKTLSDILSLLKTFGIKNGISLEDLSYLDIRDLLNLYSSSWDNVDKINKSILSGKENYKITSKIILPPLIVKTQNIDDFELPESQPNFITKKTVTASVVTRLDDISHLNGAIILIPSADPGYDWIFTHNIAGFITIYGGANSHMAIRAGELGLPAVIGAGEKLYHEWRLAKKLHIDCMNQRVEVLH